MATPAWAQKPMPPGWEAKYDQRSRKYFFVNHTTRATQWVDPRIAYYGNQPLAPAPVPAPARRPPEQIAMQRIVKNKCPSCRITEVASPNTVCRSCQVAAQQREAALMREKEARDAAQKKREQDERIKQEQERRRVQSAKRRTPQPEVTETNIDDEEAHDVPTLTMSEKIKLVDDLKGSYNDVVNDLQETYTDVTRSVIDMVLESCSYDKAMAASILNSMSTKKAAPKQASAAVRAPSPQPAAAAARAPSPQPAAPVPATTSSPTLSQNVQPSQPRSRDASPSAQTRGKVAAKSSPKPSPAKAITPFQKAQARSALKKSHPTASADLITMALDSTNYDQAKAAKVLAFATGGDTKDKAKAKTSAVSKAKSKASTSSTPTPASTSTPSTSSTVTVRSASPQPAATAQKAKKAADAKKMAAARKASPSPTRAAVKARQKTTSPTKQETRTEYVSSYSSMANGRNTSLAKGPNKDLLIDNYVHEGGADPTMKKGPNSNYVVGPSGTSSKSKMAKGPQASLRNGPQGSLAKGSLYQNDRQS